MLAFKVLDRFRDLSKKVRFKSSGLRVYRHSLEGVLGTSLELTYRTKGKDELLEIALAEIARLEKIYSCFDKSSELNQWVKQSETLELSTELLQLLEAAQFWTEKTEAAFHPGVDLFNEIWKKAETQNQVPNHVTLLESRIYFEQDFVRPKSGKTVYKVFPYKLNFNALAKGKIVDSVAKEAMRQKGIEEILMNVGGDLRHLSTIDKKVVVDVTNPFTPELNAKPRLSIEINNQAVATSGASLRDYHIAGKNYSHIINPKTGWPVQEVLSVTVIAPDCATADVLATSFNVLTPQESLELANQLPNIGCHLIDSQNQSYTNDYFKTHIFTERNTKL